VAAVALACALVAVVVLVRAGRDDGAPQLQPRPRAAARPQGLAPLQQTPAPRPRGPFGAQLARRTQLRASPGGRVIAALAMRTEYGSVRVLSVVARRGGWLGVLSPRVPNSRTAWIPAGSATILHEPYTLHVDLSARLLVVRREGRAVRRIVVGIGRAANATPPGRYAVTDRLRIVGGARRSYGCCALALTGRQPNVPQGWGGSDRLAIHGTSNPASIGTPSSSGCLHAGERDMRWLIDRIPEGAPVRIRA
jgi:hypothetical protein